MIVLKCTQDKILSVLQSVAGIVERRHNLPVLANRLSITSGFPDQAGGGASADVDCDGNDASGEAPAVAASDDEGDSEEGDPDRQTKRTRKTKQPNVGAPERSSSTNKRRDGAVNQMTSNPRADAPPNAAIPVGTFHSQNSDIALWRLPTVLAHVPVSRSHWWAGVAEGRYPAPVKLSKRCVAWRSADIRALIASF